jgi:hypothetical protein
MKRIILSALFLISLTSCFAQSVVRRGARSNTVEDVHLFAQKTFRMPAYLDTTSANDSQAVTGLDSCARLIFTYTDNRIWKRSCNPRRWQPIDDSVRISTQAGNAIFELEDGLWVKNLLENGVVFGGLVTWQGDYDYHISAATYYIGGVKFQSPDTTITLSPSDSLYNRIDVFAVNEDGEVVILEGTPAENPLQESVNPVTQLYLSFALVEAMTTEPDIEQECIYREGVEWTPTASTGRINPTSTSNPYAGTKTVESSIVLAGDNIYFTRSTPFDPKANHSVLNFKIRSKGDWGNRRLRLYFRLGGTQVGEKVNFIDGSYGFRDDTLGRYQIISIPISAFGLSSAATVDAFVVEAAQTSVQSTISMGFYLDEICLQGSPEPEPPILVSNQNLQQTLNRGYILNRDNLINSPQHRLRIAVGDSNYIYRVSEIILDSVTANFYSQGNHPYDYSHFQATPTQSSIHSSDSLRNLTTLKIYSTGTDIQQTHIDSTDKLSTFEIYRSTAGTPQDGIGQSINLYTQSASDSAIESLTHSIKSYWTSVASKNSQFEIWGTHSDVTARHFTIKSTGQLALDKYLLSSSFTGTPVGTLQFDASGNIITGSATLGGGGIASLEAQNGLTMVNDSTVRLGGTLNQNTTITGGSFGVTLTGTHTSGNPVFSAYTISSGVGVYGSSASGYGVQGSASTGTAILASQVGTGASSIGRAVEIRSTHLGSSNGFGASVDYFHATSTGGTQLANRIISKWTDATDATRTSQFEIWGVNSGTTARKLAIAGNGMLTLDGYTAAVTSGSAVYGLAVDASGNVITNALSSGLSAITADNGLTANTSSNVRLGGTLLANTTIDGGSSYRTIFTSSNSSRTLESTNTSNGYGAYITSQNSWAIYALGNQGIIAAASSSSGTAVFAQANNGFGIEAQSAAIAGSFIAANNTTTGIQEVVLIKRQAGLAASSGFGTQIGFEMSTTNPSVYYSSNKLVSKWTDENEVSRTSQFEIWGTNSAASAVKFIVKGSGVINIPTAPTTYVDNSAALAGGLVAGDLYKTATGQLMIVY